VHCEKNGIVISKIDSINQLTQAFKKMAKDPVLRCAMGKSSRQLVLSHFDFQKNLQDKTRIWNEINGN
jgi:hypothetical protein